VPTTKKPSGQVEGGEASRKRKSRRNSENKERVVRQPKTPRPRSRDECERKRVEAATKRREKRKEGETSRNKERGGLRKEASRVESKKKKKIVSQ